MTTTITAVGTDWDAIRMPRYLGLAAAEHLGDTLGTVIVEPGERRMYVLVPQGTAGRWDFPDTHALGADCYLPLPSASRSGPPGPYWLTPPGYRWTLTDPDDLRAALTAASQPPL